MPLVLYTIPEARDWLEEAGKTITEKGLREAMHRGDLAYKRIGTVYIVSEDDLRSFVARDIRPGRKKVHNSEQNGQRKENG